MKSAAVAPVFANLQPTAVWGHFAMLCRIPRRSKEEGPLRDEIRQWAVARGLAAHVDAAGNLLIRKAASQGREGAPGVVLQAHLDMVCEKNAGSEHDFCRDLIRAVVRDGWLIAEDTTLGADNGIGVALILAVLEAKDLVHGPLEALLTVDEEAGMSGARGLAGGVLQGRLMLNLDTEEWGEFYLGCAGGLDVNVRRDGQAEPLPPECTCWRIELHGLRGGHSGVDIHAERGNAIKLLVRVLRDLESRLPLCVAALTGSTARNALPREASAIVALPVQQADALAASLASWESVLRQELLDVDPGVRIRFAAATAERVMSADDQAVWLASLHAAPHGVRRMSRRIPGVVETSNNLGMAALSPDGGACNFLVRSLIESGSTALADEIASLFALSGIAAEKSGHYPGWAPNPASPLLALCQSVYRREFASESTLQVIHAGLECGILAASYPDLDIVSFGPTIRGAHAPGERVEIASVGHAWHLLTAILAAIASADSQGLCLPTVMTVTGASIA
ncbi:MAG: Cytosol non-specific dipeptidase [Candidatus Accumulibacter phosphatis]|uniref:Cytosol non-specific dipeptidase n=1 Tax=Candidatus Accumulibacter phosphatis TaxID=327160 RepID=A0A080M068_9PROT|nr:MAG: Cytosol non-specific dipeptidase [Candidatus Accumulibacter phosphatis]HCZ14537.1 cytosol nonspecific dipeptidase [Accumulibacter sp.]HRF11439.1 aminoacyl-histidine dipeptidase [Candidatus Accumulibacter phosphatis]